ncbi:MAG: proton-conducting transporter membrane subunit, partial [Candidatus Gastranaerophilaceae bacterium]
VFILNKLGDMFLFAGIIILIYFISNYPISEGSTLLAYSDLPETAADFYVYLSDVNFYFACMLMFFGTVVKSAQFPMQVWLVDSTKASIPVCSLIHSATMVVAGIILLIRLFPLFELSVSVIDTIIYTGLFTAVISTFFAIGQTEVRKMISYLTSAQLGLIIAGILSSETVIYYTAVNSFAIAQLFLIDGIVAYTFANDLQKTEGVSISSKQYPLLSLCCLISVLSLSGAFWGGFYAHNTVLAQIVSTELKAAVILFLFAVFLSAYCLFLFYFKIFCRQDNEEKKKIPFALTFSIIVCAVFVILTTLLHNKYINTDRVLVCVIITVIAAVLAYFINLKKMLPLPKFLNNLSLNGGYVSNLYNWLADNIFEFFGNFVKVTDRGIDIFVNIQAYFTRFLSWFISFFQTGNVQTYLSVSILSIIVLFLLYMLLILGIGANV